MDDQVQRELWVDASPREVWAVVTGEGWLAPETRLELHPGGEAWFRDADGVRTGWVEEASAPTDGGRPGRLAFWWSGEDEVATRVEIAVEARGTGTRVRVVEARPLEILDLVGLPLRGAGGRTFGPALVAA
ncbi:MAG TPA: hypothetical protein VE992_07035 [Solirubrobacteraceae bacterium]|nr:hypothetical protein [Solirubrobacteraceae bacterium]